MIIHYLNDGRWATETVFSTDPTGDLESVREAFGDEFNEDEYLSAWQELDIMAATNDEIVEVLFGTSPYGYWWDEDLPGVRHEIERRAYDDEGFMDELRAWALRRSSSHIRDNGGWSGRRTGSAELGNIRWETENESKTRNEAAKQLRDIIKITNCASLLIEACVGNFWNGVSAR